MIRRLFAPIAAALAVAGTPRHLLPTERRYYDPGTAPMPRNSHRWSAPLRRKTPVTADDFARLERAQAKRARKARFGRRHA